MEWLVAALYKIGVGGFASIVAMGIAGALWWLYKREAEEHESLKTDFHLAKMHNSRLADQVRVAEQHRRDVENKYYRALRDLDERRRLCRRDLVAIAKSVGPENPDLVNAVRDVIDDLFMPDASRLANISELRAKKLSPPPVPRDTDH